MTIRRRRAAVSYVPLQRAEALPIRQSDETYSEPDSALAPWGAELGERLSSHEWGRMNAPRVRARRLAGYSSKSLRAHVRERNEELTTQYLEGGAMTSMDAAARMWDGLYRAELDARRADVPFVDEDTAAEDAAEDAASAGDDWSPPEVTLLSTAGHTLTLAARAPGAPRLIAA